MYSWLDWSAVMSSTRMMGRIIFAERVPNIQGMTSRTYWTLNTIMKLENCKRHPEFTNMVDFVRRGDAFGLQVTRSASKAPLRDVAGYDPVSRNGEGNDGDTETTSGAGLMAFETVKLLKRVGDSPWMSEGVSNPPYASGQTYDMIE
uniref:Uncharacterized protein n=1 Tax=viral metagenome TaxID=1070528 RepID=A0A2V0RIV3_9ZZZZ